jgi:hypothetical protein
MFPGDNLIYIYLSEITGKIKKRRLQKMFTKIVYKIFKLCFKKRYLNTFSAFVVVVVQVVLLWTTVPTLFPRGII